MKNKKIGAEKIAEIIIVAGILLILTVIACINLFHFAYKLNADLASDVVLSGLIWESKQWIPKTWYIANEVRIICTLNRAALIYGISGDLVLSTGLGRIDFNCFSMYDSSICGIYDDR